MTKVSAEKIIPQLKPIRRIVTGHDAAGNAIFLHDGPAQQTLAVGVPTHGLTQLWRTTQTPANNEGSEDPCVGALELAPPAHGTVFRIVEFPPDREYLGKIDKKSAFAAMGEGAVDTLTEGSEIIMHRTASIDYAIMLEGEIWAVLDEDETCMRPGDVLIQRGTNHGWSNRTSKPALVAFVMVGAERL